MQVEHKTNIRTCVNNILHVYILLNDFQVLKFHNTVLNLHGFIMSGTLEVEESILLQMPLTKGMVLAFKSHHLDLTPPKYESMDPTRLQLWNKKEEIILQISIYTKQNEVSFNSHTLVSLLDGWGEVRQYAILPPPSNHPHDSPSQCMTVGINIK